MFLKTSFSTTKKLFHKTLDSVKTFFSSGYQKIPKSPPCSPLFACTGRGTDLDKFYTEFNTHWDIENDKKLPKKKNKKVSPRKSTSNYQVLEKEREEDHHEVRQKLVRFGPTKITCNNYESVGSKEDLKRKKILYEGKKNKQFSSSRELREERSYLVAQKLKELKMLEKSNEEHALDIEEVLHYYSRLTCPAYVEIVDKFFMEIYSELFNQQAISSSGYNPNTGLRRVMLY